MNPVVEPQQLQPLWPVRSDADYERALELLVNLQEKDEDARDGGYIRALALLIQDYERQNYPQPLPDPIELILGRLSDLGWSRVELAKELGISKSKVTEVLKRQRRMSLEMIRRMHEVLDLPIEVLVQEYPMSQDLDTPSIFNRPEIIATLAETLRATRNEDAPAYESDPEEDPLELVHKAREIYARHLASRPLPASIAPLQAPLSEGEGFTWGTAMSPPAQEYRPVFEPVFTAEPDTLKVGHIRSLGETTINGILNMVEVSMRSHVGALHLSIENLEEDLDVLRVKPVGQNEILMSIPLKRTD